jgi:hypothetical protein
LLECVFVVTLRTSWIVGKNRFVWELLVFTVVVVAKKALYTTTTCGLGWWLCFDVGVWGGLLAGCGVFCKQFGLAARKFGEFSCDFFLYPPYIKAYMKAYAQAILGSAALPHPPLPL